MREVQYFQTKKGLQLEYSIVGIGSPILMLHGGHSNCWEEFGYSELLNRRFSIITPSRPGYGKTSPLLGSSLETICAAYAELLDYLELDKVHVIAISAGGPSGISFAALYPGRVKSLVLQSAVTKEWLTPKDREYRAAQLLFHPSIEKYSWKMISFMTNRFPKLLFRQMLPSFSKLNMEEVEVYLEENDFEEFRKMNSRQRSGSGFLIDLQQTGQLDPVYLQAVTCSTFIIHSKNDSAVGVDHAIHASGNIPDSILLLADTWGHLIWLGRGSDLVQQELISFLRKADHRQEQSVPIN